MVIVVATSIVVAIAITIIFCAMVVSISWLGVLKLSVFGVAHTKLKVC